MIVLVLLAFGLTCATVLIHALGTWETITYLDRVWPQKKENLGFLAAEIIIVRVVSVLLLLHLLEAGIWAASYVISGTLPDFETAMYFSITSYTTVGYGDKYPVTTEGRAIGIVLMLGGVSMFGCISGLAATFFLGGRKANESDIHRVLARLEQLDAKLSAFTGKDAAEIGAGKGANP